MFKNIFSSIVKNASGLNWIRIGIAVAVGLILFFAVRYVWVGRPDEFYRNGQAAGVASQKLECEKQEKEKNEEIFKRAQAEEKRRAKIMAAPDIGPDAALQLMRLGDL